MQKKRSITQNRNIYSFTHLPAVFSAFILKAAYPVSLTLTLVLCFSPSEDIKHHFESSTH